jgi:hypothetical protein
MLIIMEEQEELWMLRWLSEPGSMLEGVQKMGVLS